MRTDRSITQEGHSHGHHILGSFYCIGCTLIVLLPARAREAIAHRIKNRVHLQRRPHTGAKSVRSSGVSGAPKGSCVQLELSTSSPTSRRDTLDVVILRPH